MSSLWRIIKMGFEVFACMLVNSGSIIAKPYAQLINYTFLMARVIYSSLLQF